MFDCDGLGMSHGKAKRSMKVYYGLSNSYKMSDGDYYARASFICNTMLGSGSEAKCFVRDYLPFMELIGHDEHWRVEALQAGGLWSSLKAKFDSDGLWPVFEERNGTCVLAFFSNGIRKSEWCELVGAFPAGEGGGTAPASVGGTDGKGGFWCYSAVGVVPMDPQQRRECRHKMDALAAGNVSIEEYLKTRAPPFRFTTDGSW
jgi:hypothetical protein